MRVGGPQSWSGRCEKRKVCCLCTDSKSRIATPKIQNIQYQNIINVVHTYSIRAFNQIHCTHLATTLLVSTTISPILDTHASFIGATYYWQLTASLNNTHTHTHTLALEQLLCLHVLRTLHRDTYN